MQATYEPCKASSSLQILWRYFGLSGNQGNDANTIIVIRTYALTRYGHLVVEPVTISTIYSGIMI